MEFVLSGFAALAEAVGYALQEMKAKNYGNAELALEVAWDSVNEFYLADGDLTKAPN